MTGRRALLTALVPPLMLPLLLAGAAAADTAPPPNDLRAKAQVVAVTSRTTGTTVGATDEATEPSGSCGATSGSVWYSFTASQSRGVLATLQAGGNLDAVVDIYLVRRSQLLSVACGVTDEHGRAETALRAEAGARYLVRVAGLPGTEQASFTLGLAMGPAPVRPPGRGLSRRGSAGTLDWALHTDAAYWVNMAEGINYRINLASGRLCMRLDIYPAGTSSFDGVAPSRVLRCGGYTVFTPPAGGSGRYVLRVNASPAARRSSALPPACRPHAVR